MLLIVGWVIALACIFVGFIVSGGHMAALVHPVKMMMIIGGAMGAFIASCTPGTLKAVLRAAPGAFKGAKYSKAVNTELLCLLYAVLSKIRKEGMISIEGEIENPEGGTIFPNYPTLMGDHHIIEFLCDYLRMMVSGTMDPNELEDLMNAEIETHHQEGHVPINMLTKLADSMPAFGIVAAVMGVVITMGSLNEPPAVLGHMIGAALVGAFVGILFGYGIFGPVPAVMEQKLTESSKAFECVKETLLASLSGASPAVAVEYGRKVLFSDVRPSFIELEEAIKTPR
ncbi:flagellar motor stator protein MotA [Pseudomarimonas arenosa]|uniref:Flagellar motor stator protein MotA n=1 Tax=Pseudomarimonas arenosa TaxID=2774145 RepID=A0AAW3ZPT8_9GAMM|nr:flagellar motor stator protein MotA [Pseudomarimonas arenosa]MBD8527968.1 flagellar motor stator protein MotA [Pseudomarimonas arenosa]